MTGRDDHSTVAAVRRSPTGESVALSHSRRADGVDLEQELIADGLLAVNLGQIAPAAAGLRESVRLHQD